MDQVDPQIQLNIRLPKSLADDIRDLAKQLRTTQSWIIRDALYNYVNHPELRTPWGQPAQAPAPKHDGDGHGNADGDGNGHPPA
jgi:hypothetical protein